MDERTAALIADLASAAEFNAGEFERSARRASWVAELSIPQFGEFLARAVEKSFPLSAKSDRLLALWLTASAQARRKQPSKAAEIAITSDEALSAIESAYQSL